MRNKQVLDNLRQVVLLVVMMGLMIGCGAEVEPDVVVTAVSILEEPATPTTGSPSTDPAEEPGADEANDVTPLFWRRLERSDLRQ